MGRPPLNIDVTDKDQRELRSLLKGGVQQVRVVLRALALLQLAQDASAPQIGKVIPLTARRFADWATVTRRPDWRARFMRSSVPAPSKC